MYYVYRTEDQSYCVIYTDDDGFLMFMKYKHFFDNNSPDHIDRIFVNSFSKISSKYWFKSQTRANPSDCELVCETESLDKDYLKENFPHLCIL